MGVRIQDGILKSDCRSQAILLRLAAYIGSMVSVHIVTVFMTSGKVVSS